MQNTRYSPIDLKDEEVERIIKSTESTYNVIEGYNNRIHAIIIENNGVSAIIFKDRPDKLTVLPKNSVKPYFNPISYKSYRIYCLQGNLTICHKKDELSRTTNTCLTKCVKFGRHVLRSKTAFLYNFQYQAIKNDDIIIVSHPEHLKNCIPKPYMGYWLVNLNT